MSFLWVTIPVSLILAGVMLGLVIHSVRRGDFDDWEGPAARVVFDDDQAPELEGNGLDPEGEEPGAAQVSDPAAASGSARVPDAGAGSEPA